MAFWPTKRDDTGFGKRSTTPPARTVAPLPAPLPPAARTKAPLPGAEPPRGIAEVRVAVRLAKLLTGSITPLRADDVLALVEPHRPRLVPRPVNPIAGMAGQPQGRMLDALLRPISQIVIDVLLPGMRDHLIDRLVRNRTAGEESLPSAVDVADAMRSLIGRLHGAGKGNLLAVVGAVEADARESADRIVRGTAPLDAGAIDTLARALLKCEVRRLSLEALGATAALQETIFQSRRVARYSLRRATEAIEGFVADRGLKALHASLATLASVDGLIVIALRNLDDQAETQEESGPFVEPADRKALNDYLSAAWRLSDTLFDLVGKAAAGGELNELLFEAMVRQLRGLHHFCADLAHIGRPATVDTLKTRLVERTEALATLAGDRLIHILLRRPADPATARRLLTRLRSLTQLLYDMGRDDRLEDLALYLIVAGETLEQAG